MNSVYWIAVVPSVVAASYALTRAAWVVMGFHAVKKHAVNGKSFL